MTDAIESVKAKLADLRDAAEDQRNSENPDLRVIAEKYQAFQDAWVDAKVEELRKEENPDADAKVEEKEIDEKVEPKPAAKSASKSTDSK